MKTGNKIKIWGGVAGTLIVAATTLAGIIFDGLQSEAEQKQNNEEIANLVVAKLMGPTEEVTPSAE